MQKNRDIGQQLKIFKENNYLFQSMEGSILGNLQAL
jgi:hypothetical protein